MCNWLGWFPGRFRRTDYNSYRNMVVSGRDFARHPQPLPPPTPNRKNASSPTNRANLSVSVFQAESVTTGGFSRAQTPILKGLALKGGPLTQPPASPVRPATPVVLSERDRAFESFKDLANGSSLISDWTTRFVANAVTYPPALTSIASHSLINGNSAISPSFPTPILASPVTPTTPLALEEPWRKIHASVSGGPTSKFPYALSLNKIENLPIPSFVDDVYLKDDARPLCLQMRLSLFDLETSTFFGRTWIDPEEFDLRAGSTATDGDSVSSSSLLDKRVAGLGILPSHESKDATLKKRRGIVLITDANGSGRNSDDEGRHDHEPRTSSKAAIKRAALAARAKSIKKKINKKLSQEKNELKEDISGSDSGSSKSERDYSEEDGDEIEDNPGIFSKKKLKHGTEKTLVHKRHQLSSDDGSDEDSSESDDNSDNDSGISSESDGAILKGHRVSINLHHEHLFMHTNLVSKNIIAVIEFVLIVEDTDVDEEEKDPDLFKPEYISAGWTYFHVFDGERGGIDIDRAWEYEEVYPYDETESCTPIFHGSPRILMFVAPLLMEYAVGYPSLAPIAGASFRFEFSTRPALRQLAYLWRENSWIGHGSDVPGLQFFSSSEMCAVEDTVAVVSKIHISVFPSLSKFELALLSEAALKHFQAFPESMTPDENGNLPLPEIIERRIHIGLHNTQTFLTAPNIITLKPVYSDYVGGDGFEFVFNGNIELEKYVAKNPGMAIVFVVEYKILMMTNQVTQKKTGLGAIIEKLTGEKKESTPLGIEKIVTVGWGAWTPTLFGKTHK
ncbi:hypothetical protein BC830DRAFT_83661 [Chytriomyces sp. MP71]|nr:hypothetical protein BC830DRAFT_83661 [Chytriomyces sp. MP71]